ncbi:MAG: hypothetical protein J0H80_10675, partial [Rhizobiales bacterium]|nr:hypothetical protein [Hyphomicrobiales bacterium]
MEHSTIREPRPDRDLERLADDAVAACGGNMREAVKALVADNINLQQELDFASLAMSFGFSRGWFAKRRQARLHAVVNGDDEHDQREAGDASSSANAV